VPGDAEIVHGVVGNLLDGEVGTGRRRDLVAHPEQPLGPPALGLEGGSQRLGGVDEIEVHAPGPSPASASSAKATSSSTRIAGSSSTRTTLRSK
jgi:hypothetical protein